MENIKSGKKIYFVEIVETLSKIVEIEADSESEAIDKVSIDYSQEKIVLDSSDFTIDVEFFITECK